MAINCAANFGFTWATLSGGGSTALPAVWVLDKRDSGVAVGPDLAVTAAIIAVLTVLFNTPAAQVKRSWVGVCLYWRSKTYRSV